MTPPPAAGKLAAYDAKNNLSGLTESVGNSTQGYTYNYDPNNRITSVVVGDTTVTYEYDAFSRLVERETKQGDATVKTETYTFVNWTDSNNVARTTSQIATYAVTIGGTTTTLSYTYDQNGNILSISDGTNVTSYVYDAANQLVRENNQAEGYTHAWVYDDAGNIRFRKEYAYTTVESLANVTPNKTVAYDYNDETWGDLLTSYDNQQIEYDGIGNPEEWGNRTFTWEKGRRLASLTEGTTTWAYTYDNDGMRTSRTNGTKTYTYTYNGSQLVQMTVGSDVLRFTYDAAGTPLTVTYDDDTYYYVTNIQGDVVSIVDAGGNEVASYSYDAWGKLLLPEVSTEEELENVASSLEDLNPLRYRGYVYDTEIGLYYVSSRYYDSEIGRWINADDTAYLGADGTPLSYNLFAYCKNNPVMGYDPTGHWSFWGAVIGGVVGAVVGGIAAAVTGGDIGDIIIGAVAGGLAGAVIGVTGNLEAGKAVGRAVGSGINAVGSYITARKNGASVGGAVAAAGASFVITYATASISGVRGLDLLTSTMVDATIGTGGALCNSAITSVIANASSESHIKTGGQVKIPSMKNVAMKDTNLARQYL